MTRCFHVREITVLFIFSSLFPFFSRISDWEFLFKNGGKNMYTFCHWEHDRLKAIKVTKKQPEYIKMFLNCKHLFYILLNNLIYFSNKIINTRVL